MAWIKSYQELERHPKTMVLMKEMNWSLDMTISKLHRLWWWCADYAYDGNIEKHDPDTISTAIGCADMKGEALINALVKAGFVDREPYLRLHDWWAHFGDFLYARFARTPEKWKRVRDCYLATSKQSPSNPPTNKVLKEINKGNKEIQREHTFVLPSWIDKKTWEAYLEIRKVKKATATTHALKLIIMALERFRSEGMDPNMVLEKSIMSGWTGVFPLKVDFSKQPQKAYVGPKLPPGGTMVDGWGSGTEEEKRILEGK